ncbi:hypothetical protein [Vreelandella venusta]|uniref:hypothetical protein n=1 Tax=Vreelandella venusta TaxID=44935 RepID=UPI00200FEC04|nr:hypothetical protein [Halomonas venusta]UQI41906.1 hypothetical protein M3L73_06510 [Halomonas venusta]
MPLSKVEHQVLALICDEHHQTRRGAKTSIVHVGMNAVTSQQKARIVDVLLALKKRGLVVFGDEAWLPTTEGEGALRGASVPSHSAQPAPPTPPPIEDCPASVERIGAPMPDELLNRCAAMNAALLAQATRSYEAGVPGAWRDMNWLIETGKKLLALGGEV